MEKVSAREVAAQFEGMLLAQAFAPVAKALGFFGEMAVAQVSTQLARGDGALRSALERTIEDAQRSDVLAAGSGR